MTVFFYVQHLLGIGHLKRAAILARALRDTGIDVVLASGGARVASIAVDVQLPEASAADAGFRTLLDATGRPITDDWKRRRAAALLDAWRAARADALLVELFPFGRRQMRFELLPLLEDARRHSPRPLIACSVRDLLQPRPERESETLELVQRYFDHVLVHGDPQLARLDLTFGAAAKLGDRLHYTGYIVAPAPPAREAHGEVLVSAGGGAVGRRLLESALAARGQTLLRGARWRLLAGINAADADLRALAREAGAGVIVERNREDFQSLLPGAALSISQAGYNTVAEILQAQVRSVLVPFAAGDEAEQALRARLLAERGAALVLDERSLTPQSLADAVNRAARGPQPQAGGVDLDGARRSAELVGQWLQ
jgi:predicted glycosyltransferase